MVYFFQIKIRYALNKAEGGRQSLYTTGILKFAECFYVCRVYSLGHSANKIFAECCAKNIRQKKTPNKDVVCRVSKKHSAKMGFAECFLFCTRQRNKIFFSEKEGEEKNKKKFLPSA